MSCTHSRSNGALRCRACALQLIEQDFPHALMLEGDAPHFYQGLVSLVMNGEPADTLTLRKVRDDYHEEKKTWLSKTGNRERPR